MIADQTYLVKLADRLERFGRILEGARKHENNNLSVWSTDAPLISDAVTALRRLASSDSGVKVRKLEWQDCPALGGRRKFVAFDCFGNEYRRIDLPMADLDAAKAAAQADYEQRIRSALVEVPAVKGEPEPVAWAELGSRGQVLTVRPEESAFCTTPLYTAPPADAGMREALGPFLVYLRRLRSQYPDSPSDTVIVAGPYDLTYAHFEAIEALTAPGATTKSGDVRWGDSGPIPGQHFGDEFAAEPSPSDPSSDDVDTCIACDLPLIDGDMVYSDAGGGCIHAACCGPERESYVGNDGKPLKDGEPIPTP